MSAGRSCQNVSARRKPLSMKNRFTPQLPNPSTSQYPGKRGIDDRDHEWWKTTVRAATPRSASMPGSQVFRLPGCGWSDTRGIVAVTSSALAELCGQRAREPATIEDVD